MGMFFHEEPDRFPQLRKTGFLRYRQVLERNWKQFFLADLLTLGLLLPFGVGVACAVLSSSILVLAAVCVLGGIPLGFGLSAMYDCILRALRDCRDDWWHSFKKALRQNWRCAIIPGIVTGFFLGFLTFAFAMLWWAGRGITPGTAAVLLAGCLVFLMVSSVLWPQLVLFEQRLGIQLKNSLLFILRYFGKTLGAAALQLVWWVLAVLFFPWTAFLVPFLGVWYILFLSTLMLYPHLDEAFSIETQIAARFPEQMAQEE